MEEIYVTIVGFSNYYGREPFKIGAEFQCAKEPDNAYDSEAIKVTLPIIGTVGYLANCVNTKANGTSTAGRIYEKLAKPLPLRSCLQPTPRSLRASASKLVGRRSLSIGFRLCAVLS